MSQVTLLPQASPLDGPRTTNISKHSPGVVAFAEDHPALRETRRSNVRQRGLATRALEAPVVPVAVERVQQEPVHDLGPAAGAAPGAGTAPAARPAARG